MSKTTVEGASAGPVLLIPCSRLRLADASGTRLAVAQNVSSQVDMSRFLLLVGEGCRPIPAEQSEIRACGD
jgi:hypothetical protein